MKKTYTTNLLLLIAFILVATFTPQKTQAQSLEEIPNPPDFELSWFSGGEDGDLFFEYLGPNYSTEIFHYDGTDLMQVPFTTALNFSFYSHEYDEKFYIVGFDFNFVSNLYEYDPSGSDPADIVPVPDGFDFENYVATYNDLMYVTLVDDYFDQFFYQYDGTEMTEVQLPAGVSFGSFISEFNDLLYLSVLDSNFENKIYQFDGTNFIEVTSPTDLEFSFFLGETDTKMFLSFVDSDFNNILYTYDGTNLTEIENPTDFQLSWQLSLSDDVSFLTYFDASFNESIFKLENNALTEITIPAGFQFPAYVNEFDDKHFFSLFDSNFDQLLFRYDGNDVAQVTTPATWNIYNQYAGIIDNKAYYIFFDNNFNLIFSSLEAGSDALIEVDVPTDFTFGNFGTIVNDKLFLGLNDGNFDQTLFIYDGDIFTEVTNPIGKTYDFLLTDDQGYFYLRYRDQDFVNTLYKLLPNSLPTSADNEVFTLVNVPYFFSTDNFDFADSDGDMLASIMITEVEQVGNLFNDGGHVFPGDIIEIGDLENLVFFPNTDDQGLNYDLFKFRVSDGDDFSNIEYTMTINVVEALSNSNVMLNANVLLHPVPVENFANLQINASQNIESLNLRIIGMNGKILFQNNYENLGEEFQHSIDVSQLPAGQYILHGTTPHGNIAKPFVK